MKDPQLEMDLKHKKIIVRSGAPQEGEPSGNPWDEVLRDATNEKRAS